MAPGEAMDVDTVPLVPASGKAKVDRVLDGKDAPWVEKYRPRTLDDVAAHKEIIDTSAPMFLLPLPLPAIRLCAHAHA
jgi:hypothetical protein